MKKTTEAHLSFLQSLPGWEQLEEDLACQYGEEDHLYFLCYDIHSLRRINRAYGRRVGDALLSAVAQWTQDLPGSHLYRIEGDEFCILFTNTELARVQNHASSLEARFGKAWHLETNEGHVDLFALASIAIVGDLDCDYTSELPDLAEQALELSRKNQQITTFTAEYDRTTREHVRLQMELRHCILSDMLGFSVAYQPLADPSTGTWRGLEALCRWEGPTIGRVPPNIFIEEAEEMGLIPQLGDWVLNSALEACGEMGLDKLEHFFVSVNVSALQMSRRNYVRAVIDALDRHQYPAEKLLLEITESTQFTFNETTMATIDMLRAKGVLFALDDFGSGYSGFSSLKNLPVDMLKTDRDFIENIENDTYLQYFYYIMSETAHASNMRLIAEGIETSAQLHSVVKNGADLIQGYLFGRPMPRQVIEQNIANFTVPVEQFSGWMSGTTDFKQWIYSRDAYEITPSLFGLQSRCINILFDEDDLGFAINKILETTGIYFKVSRAYIFLREEGTVFSNRFEWCAEGVEPQKHLFQHIDGSQDGFYDVLCENEIVLAANANQLPDNMRQRLESGGQQDSIQAMAVMPMRQRGEILGFVGFDNRTSRDWMPEELIILHNLCLLCLIVLFKTQEDDKPDKTL